MRVWVPKKGVRSVEIEELAALLNNYFLAQGDVTTVYLFGSFTQGYARPSSDVDLALLFSRGLDTYSALFRQLDFANELEHLLKRPVDVINLETAKPAFVHQVLLHKKIVVDKDQDLERRVQFEVKHRSEYFDMLPFYHLYHEQAIKRLRGVRGDG